MYKVYIPIISQLDPTKNSQPLAFSQEISASQVGPSHATGCWCRETYLRPSTPATWSWMMVGTRWGTKFYTFRS